MGNTPKIVIGAGYGDEGKGLITDYLCAAYGADVVVRFNGGSQAGHTVQLPSGERHVFCHFGAGTFAGAATYLSEHFIVNPMTYFKEQAILASSVRVISDIYVDPRALVTTPYDMLINQLAEEFRGADRHGSCGIGINETVTRCMNLSRATMFGMLEDKDEFVKRLTDIRDNWFPDRCKYLGIDPTLGKDVISNKNIFNNFIEDALEMYENCFVEDPDFLNSANQIVFEGAQGLLLDEVYGAFPYVTRSRTGLVNALDILDQTSHQDIDVTYVTRCYLTRHGAGPLTDELTEKPYKNIVDKTNKENTYQGKLRFAYLDINQLAEAINYDVKTNLDANDGYYRIHHGLAVTCLDQLDNDTAKVYLDGSLQTLKGDVYGDVGDMINAMVDSKLDSKFNRSLLKSFGPTRFTMESK